jgi:amino acid adenylation domain-containing protein
MSSDPNPGFRNSSIPATLVELLCRRGCRQSPALAYEFLVDGELDARAMTYGELHVRAQAIGAALQAQAHAGDRVVIVLPPGLDYIATFFGCLYAGLVAVPVPLPERRRGLPRLLSIIRDCRPRVAISTSALAADVMRADEPELQALSWISTDDVPASASSDFRVADVTGETLAFLQYTSGSTGAPKGVRLTHQNLLSNQRSIQRAFAQTEQSVIVGWLPPHHDMGLIGNILQPLYLGVPCVQMAPRHFLTRPIRWLRAISRYRGTASGGPNFAYDLCVDRTTPDERRELDLSSWTVAFNGAEPVRATTLEQFSHAFACAGFRKSAFLPCFGLAEATLLVSGSSRSVEPTVCELDRAALEQGHARAALREATGSLALVGSGPPCDADVLIVDPHDHVLRADGEVGEIWVRGASVAQGYWEKPEETAEVFEARLASGDGPFLRTGDLGFSQAGELFVTGRIKDLIIIRGRNLYPQDIELCVERSGANLGGAGTIAFAIDRDGEERLVVVAETSLRSQERMAEAASRIRLAIASELEVALEDLVFVARGRLPRTTSGKLQRRSCRNSFLQGQLPELWLSSASRVSAASARTEVVEASFTALEAGLAAIWSDVLGCQQPKPSDEFLDLGGDSLKAMQVAARASELTGVELSSAQLFETTTIATLAHWIGAQQATPAKSKNAGPRTESAPLSFIQERLWFLEQLVAPSPVYQVAAALRLKGQLDPAALRRALEELVSRHEALRTSFKVQDGRAEQVVEAPHAVSLELQRPQDPREYLRETARRSLGLDGAPVRFELVAMADDEHALTLNCHHLLVDGWSMAILLDELTHLYAAHAIGTAPLLPAPSCQVADHALAQRGAEGSPAWQRQLDYWRARFQVPVTPLQLPTDRPRPALQTYAGARETVVLSEELCAAVAALGRRHGTTLFATISTALFILLERYTGQSDLCVGTPVAGRDSVELQSAVGCFINTLPLRVDLTGEPPVSEALLRVRRLLEEAQAHQQVPFERVLSELSVPRALDRSPLFQVMISMQPPLPEVPELPGLRVSAEQLDAGTAQLDLSLDLVATGAELRCVWEYNTDLFDGSTVRRFGEQLRLVLERMVEDPSKRVGELSMLTARERERLGKSTRIVAPPEHCVHELVEIQAARRPDAVALVCGNERLSYAALLERARRFAARLQQLGVSAESRVGVFLERSTELVASVLGVLQAGGAYVALDPMLPAERVGFMLRDAAVSAVITSAALRERLPGSFGGAVVLSDELDGAPAFDALDTPYGLDRIAYLLYTSGSTGRPKGVMVSHRSLLSAVAAWQDVYRLPQGGLRLMQLASPSFDVWTADWVRALCSGGCLIIAPPEAALDAAALTALARRERVNALDIVPALVESLLECWRGQAPELELLIVGSDAWSMRTLRALRPVLPSTTRLLSCYGVTEATIDSAFYEADPEAQPSDGPVPLGSAFPNTRLHVVDRRGSLLPWGGVGELAIGGAGVARGYWQNPRLTAERFRPDPFSSEPGARLYLSGDRARLRADGALEFLGRVDHQMKLRGVRIEVGEIEASLRRQSGVRDAAVVLGDDGRGEKCLTAYFVTESGAACDLVELRATVRAELPEVMVPAHFVQLQAFPLSDNGKLDRKRLPAPVIDGGHVPATQQRPAGELELRIASIWAEVLSISEPSVNDNFFDLGGHSLRLSEVASRLRAVTGRDVPLLLLFRHPTIATLARALESQSMSTNEESAPDLTQVAQGRERRAAMFARRRGGGETSK